MYFEELFSPFTRDALNFRPLKIYATQHRPAVFRFHSPPAIITAPCDAPFNIPCYHCALCTFTAHAKAKYAQIMRRQEISM